MTRRIHGMLPMIVMTFYVMSPFTIVRYKRNLSAEIRHVLNVKYFHPSLNFSSGLQSPRYRRSAVCVLNTLTGGYHMTCCQQLTNGHDVWDVFVA